MCPSFQQNHWTALHIASNKGHAEVVEVLLAAKATVNTEDKVSSTLYAMSRHMTCLIGVVCSMVTHCTDWTVSSLVSQFQWSPESGGTVDQSWSQYPCSEGGKCMWNNQCRSSHTHMHASMHARIHTHTHQCFRGHYSDLLWGRLYYIPTECSHEWNTSINVPLFQYLRKTFSSGWSHLWSHGLLTGGTPSPSHLHS